MTRDGFLVRFTVSATQKLVGGSGVERAAAEPVGTPTRRRRRAAEHFRFAVEESLEPEGRAVAAQRIGAKPKMLERFEHRPQVGVQRYNVVAVQPEILDGGVERAKNGRREVVQVQ